MTIINENSMIFDLENDLLFIPWDIYRFSFMYEEELRIELITEWKDIIKLFKETNPKGKIISKYLLNSLRELKGDLVIMGHGEFENSTNIDQISLHNGYRISAKKLATILFKNGLPINYCGKIIVWSCWGGLPGGMAHNLYLKLCNYGYKSLSVWGPNKRGGSDIFHQRFIHVLENIKTNEGISPFRDMTRADMVCYGAEGC